MNALSMLIGIAILLGSAFIAWKIEGDAASWALGAWAVLLAETVMSIHRWRRFGQ